MFERQTREKGGQDSCYLWSNIPIAGLSKFLPALNDATNDPSNLLRSGEADKGDAVMLSQGLRDLDVAAAEGSEGRWQVVALEHVGDDAGGRDGDESVGRGRGRQVYEGQ